MTDAGVVSGELFRMAFPGPAHSGGPRACSVVLHMLTMCEVPCLAFQALRDEGEIPGLMRKVRICMKSYQGHTVGDRLSAVQEGSQCF